MDTLSALNAFGAISQETRLAIFRLLVRNALDGLPAGQIAHELALPGPTLSFHLNVLAAADLVRYKKYGRSITYTANLPLITDLVEFLTEDCCGGLRDCTAPGPERKARANSGKKRKSNERGGS